MFQSSLNQTQGSLRKPKGAAGMLVAVILVLAVSGLSLATQGNEAQGDSAKRKVRLVTEEEFFKAVGAVPAQEVLTPEEYKSLAKTLPEQANGSTERCHVHCTVSSDGGVTCVKHRC